VTVAVAIMAKAPRPGAVKTRLCPPLTAAQSAALARCFLRDTIDSVRRLCRAQPVIAYAPTRERALFERLAPGLALVPQRGHDLGARMRSVLRALLTRGHPAAIVIGTDTPTLPTARLQRGVDLVASGRVDVVLGPAADGGYYLVGVRADHPGLFEGIAWSTPAVLDTTLRRARAGGLRTACLPTWRDIDTPDDLSRLRAELARTRYTAPATRRLLAALG
jgi:hypothetical protein